MSKMKQARIGLSNGIFAVVDTETTNASPQYGRIIEVAVLRIEKGKVVRTFHSLVNPERPVQPQVEAVTGITVADLESAPSFGDIAKDLDEVLSGALFVAHNAKFDYAFLRSEFRRARRSFATRCLCTVALSKHFSPGFAHHDLSSLIVRHQLPCEHRHRALDDAKALWAFLSQIEEIHGAEALGAYITKETSRGTPSHLGREVIRELPESHGVYLMYGGQGELLYIGKSNNIRRRVQSHFSMGNVEGYELQLSQETRHVEARSTAGELGALLLESRLIKELHPVHNRAARAKRSLVVLTRHETAEGYYATEIESRDKILPQEIADILTVFKHRAHARQFLLDVAREYSLCQKLLGLERTHGACFRHQLHRCNGACVGEESPRAYNARFIAAFEERKIQSWPFRSGILITEKGEDSTSEEAFLIDHWCLLSSIRYGDGDFQEVIPGFDTFDHDSYKILLRYLGNPRNRRSVRILTVAEYGGIIAQLHASG
jgi:DNA polymerase-3 subunit epsilon